MGGGQKQRALGSGQRRATRRTLMRRILGVLIITAAAVAAASTLAGSASGSTAVCAPVPNPSGTGYWTTFGTAAWGPNGLVTTSQADPRQAYGVTCGGASVYGPALRTTGP